MRRLLIVPALLLLPTPAVHADLPEYVKAPDPSFAWELSRSDETPNGTVHHIDLTSQTWRGITWTHPMRVYEPSRVEHEQLAVLYITGGSSRGQHRPSDDLQGFALARAAGCRVAVLPRVPNQPLLGDRYEDDLIGETFLNFLRTGEQDWPLLQPMVKSAVKAMDAVQAFASERGRPVEGFVVTGASKRGWTTWLTGAVDDRVAAIAPMVIPTLNMRANTENQMALWGAYSDQIEDYTRRGLTESFATEQGARLWKMVDPYFYLDRIDVPVLQINGTNDAYWTHDSMRFYWDAIRGPKHVTYLPNAGHGLDEHQDYAVNGVAALARHVAAGRELPTFSWGSTREDGTITFSVEATGEVRPKAVSAWVARSADRDFRDDRWVAMEADTPRSPANGGGDRRSIRLDAPSEGSVAVLFDLTFEVDGLGYHLSTPIHEFRPDPAEDVNAGGEGG